MKTLGARSQTVNISFPDGWDPEDLSALTLQVFDTEGTAVLEDVSVALYTAAVLEYQADRYTDTIRLTDAAGAFSIGDNVRIIGVNGYEDHTVKGYDPTNHYIYIEQPVDRPFEDGAFVYRMHGVATTDLSGVTAGTTLVFTWEPTGTGDRFSELYLVEDKVQVDTATVRGDLRDLYPRAYKKLTEPEDRLSNMINMAIVQVTKDLQFRMVDINRIVDQQQLTPLIVAKVAFLWSAGGDKDSIDEREFLSNYYDSMLDQFCGLPIWQDDDDDGILDEGEETAHLFLMNRTW